MPDGFIQLPADSTGKRLKTWSDGTDHYQQVITAEPKTLSRGRVATFRTPGRAGTTGANLLAFWNGSASRACKILFGGVDLVQTAVRAATVVPPVVRWYRMTAAPTNGTVLTKALEDTSGASDANITVRGDASADGTLSATALTATAVGGPITHEFAPRLLAIGTSPATNLYEPFDKCEFFDRSPVVIRPSEGLLCRLDYTVATANPATDFWIVNLIWNEE